MRALFAIDLRSLALFRIATATLLLVDLASRARLLTENYSDAGAYPRATVLVNFPIGALPSLHLLSGSARFQLGLFVLAGIAAALLLVGYAPGQPPQPPGSCCARCTCAIRSSSTAATPCSACCCSGACSCRSGPAGRSMRAAAHPRLSPAPARRPPRRCSCRSPACSS